VDVEYKASMAQQDLADLTLVVLEYVEYKVSVAS
jgi:hypothetical protein